MMSNNKNRDALIGAKLEKTKISNFKTLLDLEALTKAQFQEQAREIVTI